jgi:HD superfamily phosphodiesterase
MDQLKNTNQLLTNKDYSIYLKKIATCEEDRRFCRHDLNHFLSVARIALIKSTEAGFSLSKDLIYTAALLHDIGRFIQYEDKTPHEIASHQLSIKLLEPLDFSPEEKDLILNAILNHRNASTTGFNRIFYESDKLSRACFSCPVEKECDWSLDKKNLTITY